MRLRDGTVVVADAVSSELRFFDAKGKFLRRAAGRGSGPGEVQGIGEASAVRDTIYVFDANGPMLVYDADGKWLRRADPAHEPPGFVLRSPRAVLTGGSVAGFRALVARSLEGLRADSFKLVLKSSGSDTGRVLDVYPREEGFDARGRLDIVAFAASPLVVAFEAELCATAGVTFQVTCRRPDGTRTRVIGRSDRARTVTPQMRHDMMRARSGIGPDGTPTLRGEQRAQRERAAKSLQFAKFLPMISALLAGRDGTLWVREAQPADYLVTYGFPPYPDPRHWRLYGRDGVEIGDIILPGRFKLYDAGAGWVLGARWDEDDTERVTMFRIRR